MVTKTFSLLFLIQFFLLNTTVFAKINPFYKEAEQRGYTITQGDSVIFPDGSQCSIADFNERQCGQEWMTDNYCIGEGDKVWDEYRCCVGLEPHLEENTDGHKTCERVGTFDWLESKVVLYFFLGLILPFTIFVVVAWRIRKKLGQRNVRD